MAKIWAADLEILELINKVKDKYHLPRLEGCSIAANLTDANPYRNGKFNWGKVQKISSALRIWQGDQYHFLLTFSDAAINEILKDKQREAAIDLLLNCCGVEFEPEVDEKKKPLLDEYGRTIYTEVRKVDDDGEPKWKLESLDIYAFQLNVKRYGFWIHELDELKEAMKNAKVD